MTIHMTFKTKISKNGDFKLPKDFGRKHCNLGDIRMSNDKLSSIVNCHTAFEGQLWKRLTAVGIKRNTVFNVNDLPPNVVVEGGFISEIIISV